MVCTAVGSILMRLGSSFVIAEMYTLFSYALITLESVVSVICCPVIELTSFIEMTSCFETTTGGDRSTALIRLMGSPGCSSTRTIETLLVESLI
jgi:hypothetical protein